jgi:RecA-family ATPase
MKKQISKVALYGNLAVIKQNIIIKDVMYHMRLQVNKLKINLLCQVMSCQHPSYQVNKYYEW